MPTPYLLVRDMDWALLRKLKAHCVEKAAENKDGDYRIYDDLVSLMTSLQDCAAENCLASERAIYGGGSYNHMFSVAFTVAGSNDPAGEDITAGQFYKAMLKRALDLLNNNEFSEAVGEPIDTFKEGE